MIKIRQRGNFEKLTKYFMRVKRTFKFHNLDKYGEQGVVALSSATPVDSGNTASKWYYEIEKSNGITRLSFKNSNINKGVPIAIILQYGHGTRNGGYVEGIDYINPAIQPIFQKIADDAWREVTKQ